MSILDPFWRLPDYLQHSLFAAAAMGVFGGIAWALGQPHPPVLGALAGILIYYGREIADADSENRALLTSWKALLPWKWHWDSQSDFYWPLATNSMLAAAIEAWVHLV